MKLAENVRFMDVARGRSASSVEVVFRLRTWGMVMRQLFALAASLVVFAVGSFVLSSPTAARTIRVDFGAGNYDFTGQAWSLVETPVVPPAPVSGTLPFAIDFGTGPQTAFCLYEDGLISFGATNCSDPVPSDARLEPLAADWIATPGATSILDPGSITYNEGNLARESPFPANPLDAPQAVRFTWFDVTCACDGFQYSFQAILINQGGGDFDLELNYNGIPASVGNAGFTLGPNTFSFSGPFDSATDHDFQFRNGVTTPVDEPGVAPLLAIACAALAVVGWRRRVTPLRAAA